MPENIVEDVLGRVRQVEFDPAPGGVASRFRGRGCFRGWIPVIRIRRHRSFLFFGPVVVPAIAGLLVIVAASAFAGLALFVF